MQSLQITFITSCALPFVVVINTLFIFSEYAYRYDLTEAVGLPSIPVHPIGYDDAQKLLE